MPVVEAPRRSGRCIGVNLGSDTSAHRQHAGSAWRGVHFSPPKESASIRHRARDWGGAWALAWVVWDDTTEQQPPRMRVDTRGGAFNGRRSARGMAPQVDDAGMVSGLGVGGDIVGFVRNRIFYPVVLHVPYHGTHHVNDGVVRPPLGGLCVAPPRHRGGIRSVRSPLRRAPLLATPIAMPLQCGRPKRSGLLVS